MSYVRQHEKRSQKETLTNEEHHQTKMRNIESKIKQVNSEISDHNYKKARYRNYAFIAAGQTTGSLFVTCKVTEHIIHNMSDWAILPLCMTTSSVGCTLSLLLWGAAIRFKQDYLVEKEIIKRGEEQLQQLQKEKDVGI